MNDQQKPVVKIDLTSFSDHRKQRRLAYNILESLRLINSQQTPYSDLYDIASFLRYMNSYEDFGKRHINSYEDFGNMIYIFREDYDIELLLDDHQEFSSEK